MSTASPSVVSFASHAFTEAEYDAAAARITTLAAHINAAHAELARLAADFDTRALWFGWGIRTCRHWLTINTGLGEHSADELLRIGHAVASLPCIREAFETGRLSLDKVRLLTRVATADDEDIWLEMGLHASGAQLGRIVRGFERAADDGARLEERRTARGLWAFWRRDGMLELRALLTTEDGAAVLAALDAVAARTGVPERTPEAVLQAGGTMIEASRAGLEPADPRSAGRADALSMICEAIASGSIESLARDVPAHRLIVHVDAGVLTGEDPRGRCQVENGPGLAAAVAQRLGCDAEMVALVERDGKPIDVCRMRRIPSARMKLAIKARDEGCRFPGCAVPAKPCDVHHVRLWDGRNTVEDNLLCLCRFHHVRHHDGAFSIRLDKDRRPVFVNPRGRAFGEPGGAPLVAFRPGEMLRLLGGKADGVDATTAVAKDHGGRFDLELAVWVLHTNTEYRRRLAAGDSSP